MYKETRIPWLRLGTESAAIVGSILLAFAIDAWWDSRIDDKNERQLLGALISEFEETLLELRNRHVTVISREQAADTLRKLDEQSIRQLASEELITLFLQASSQNRADPPTGVLNSAISSGKISLIQNQELATLLAGWEGRLMDMRNTEEDIATHLSLVFWPSISSKAVVPERGMPVENSFREAMLDTTIINYLSLIRNLSGVNAIENERLQAEAQQILDLLNHAIE